jgi:hypothetical protein
VSPLKASDPLPANSDTRYLALVWREYGVPTFMVAHYFADVDGDREYVLGLFPSRDRKSSALLAEHADKGTFELLADCADRETANQICLKRTRKMRAEYYPKQSWRESRKRSASD